MAEKRCGCEIEPGGYDDSEAEYDSQRIYLCRACPQCRNRKMGVYREEILTSYTQADVDEQIEEIDR